MNGCPVVISGQLVLEQFNGVYCFLECEVESELIATRGAVPFLGHALTLRFSLYCRHYTECVRPATLQPLKIRCSALFG